jgi:hypothetical protein
MSLLFLLSCAVEPQPFAHATVMEDRSDGIGGPKALARAGDIVLENDKVRFVITQGGTSMGPSLYGGSIIDADLNRGPGYTGGLGNDRLAESFPTVNMNVPLALEPETVWILNDGANGEPAIVRTQADAVPFITLLKGLWAFIGAPDFYLTTDYILKPGESWVTIKTTAHMSPELPDQVTALSYEPDMPLLEYAIETGMSFGDFYLQGGDVNVFSPGIGFWENGAVYDARDAGQNTFLEPFELDYVGGTSDGVSYGLASLTGPVYVPLFTSSQTAAFGVGLEGDEDAWGNDRFGPTDAFSYERVMVVGDGDMGSVVTGILEARGTASGTLTGHVLEEGTTEPLSGIYVFVYEPGAELPWSQFTTDVSWSDQRQDGSFGGNLPVGDWELLVRRPGIGTGERIPVTISAGGEQNVVLTAPRAGHVQFEVVDETGLTVPSKVSIFPSNGQPVRDPVLGDGYIAGNPEAVVFNPFGVVDVALPPGDYVAYATRGFEYELGVAEFTVTSGGRADVELQVWRSVDTTGWVSADFHVHAQPSHDSGVTPPARVGTMVSEHVEFLVSTDHDYITDYRPHIENLGLEPWISSAVGLETTTIEAGHFLGFPLVADHLDPSGGAFDWTGLTPDEMIGALKDLGGDVEPVTFVAHPRDGILGYFDQFGFDPYTGEVTPGLLNITNPLLADPSNFSFEYEALELLNGKRYEILRTPTAPEMELAVTDDLDPYEMVKRTMDEQQDLIDGTYTLGADWEGQVDDWFTLLNLGYRYTALGNSDTHGTTSTESGCPRNYVVSSTDDPAFISTEEMAEAVRNGNILTTYGPFVRFVANDVAIMGDELEVSGDVEFFIEVQSPTWFDVHRVEVYRNGELVHEIEATNNDIVNVSETWTDTPDQDSWYVVIVMGNDSLEPLFTPVEYAPVQLQDVVIEALGEVDAVADLLSAAPPLPRTFPVYPFALTNPIYVNVDGGEWTAPGIPAWLVPPAEPEE